jgi:hypothetical protein
VAAICIAIPALVELGLGAIYLTASDVMPYHREVVGVDWGQVEPGARTLLVALVNAYGSAHLAAGIALGVLALVPLRQGQPWARWAILGVGLPVLGGTAWVSARLALATGAGIPWEGAVFLLGLLVLGVALARPEGASGDRVARGAKGA